MILTKKSNEEIEFYLEVGKKFNMILLNLKNYVLTTKKPLFTNNIEQEFISLCNSIFDEYSCPFRYIENTLKEKYGHPCCISINDEVAHGSAIKKLEDEDIVKIDCGITVNKYNFDAAFTIKIGDMKEEDEWIYAPKIALKNIIDLNPKDTAEVSEIIQKTAEKYNLNYVVSVCGHGIGKELHEAPFIHNAVGNFVPVKLFNNICFCPEPAFVKNNNEEKSTIEQTYVDSDYWTIKTMSGNKSTHFETVLCVYDNQIIDTIGISKW